MPTRSAGAPPSDRNRQPEIAGILSGPGTIQERIRRVPSGEIPGDTGAGGDQETVDKDALGRAIESADQVEEFTGLGKALFGLHQIAVGLGSAHSVRGDITALVEMEIHLTGGLAIAGKSEDSPPGLAQAIGSDPSFHGNLAGSGESVEELGSGEDTGNGSALGGEMETVGVGEPEDLISIEDGQIQRSTEAGDIVNQITGALVEIIESDQVLGNAIRIQDLEGSQTGDWTDGSGDRKRADRNFQAGPQGQNPVAEPTNQAPSVSAGPDQAVVMSSPVVASLDATVSDDGLPEPPAISTIWSAIGPAPVVFGDSSAVDTNATIYASGGHTYSNRLSAALRSQSPAQDSWNSFSSWHDSKVKYSYPSVGNQSFPYLAGVRPKTIDLLEIPTDPVRGTVTAEPRSVIEFT